MQRSNASMMMGASSWKDQVLEAFTVQAGELKEIEFTSGSLQRRCLKHQSLCGKQMKIWRREIWFKIVRVSEANVSWMGTEIRFWFLWAPGTKAFSHLIKNREYTYFMHIFGWKFWFCKLSFCFLFSGEGESQLWQPQRVKLVWVKLTFSFSSDSNWNWAERDTC